MSRGRPRTPTHLRIITGNPQHRPLPSSEPKPGDLPAPVMPPWLREVDLREMGLLELPVTELKKRAGEVGAKKSGTAEQLRAAILDAEPGPREAAWQEYAPVLEEIGVLTGLDSAAFAMAIDQYVTSIRLRLHVAEHGATYETEGRYGLQAKRRPEVVIANEAWDRALRALIEFGMTAVSRSKVDIRKRGDRSPLGNLLDGEGASA